MGKLVLVLYSFFFLDITTLYAPYQSSLKQNDLLLIIIILSYLGFALKTTLNLSLPAVPLLFWQRHLTIRLSRHSNAVPSIHWCSCRRASAYHHSSITSPANMFC